jgi:hypothetical protein
MRDYATLTATLQLYLATGATDGLITYLLLDSHLPGPRGNLELAQSWAEVVASAGCSHAAKLWPLCVQLAGMASDMAPANDPCEFASFCGVRGLGALGAVQPAYYSPGLELLHSYSAASRWRVREGVAMALQDLIAAHAAETITVLAEWIAPGAWLAMRAVAAGVAEPRLLADQSTARAALTLHGAILEQVRHSRERHNPNYRVLRQALGYSLSVVVTALPSAGFALLDEMLDEPDTDIDWIVRQNLRKARLCKRHPEQVARATARLEQARQ